jgi:superfamily II DNA/RNA helicase
MAKKQNNMKRKKTGLGRGSCAGGKRSFSEGGRKKKRDRKIARNVARDQARQLEELQDNLILEKALSKAVDWKTSGASISERKKLKRFRKAHKRQAPMSQGEADAAASVMGLPAAITARTPKEALAADAAAAAASTNPGEATTSTTVSLWRGETPAAGEIPSDALKLQRKALGVRVAGRSCPPPISTVDDERMPEESFSKLWRFQEPTAVQRQLWPVALCGLDCVAVAPTGSGKTLAYILPAIARVVHARNKYKEDNGADLRGGDGRAAAPRAMVCVPTRELAAQVVEVCTTKLRVQKKLHVHCVGLVGGKGTKGEQIDQLLRGKIIC